MTNRVSRYLFLLQSVIYMVFKAVQINHQDYNIKTLLHKSQLIISTIFILHGAKTMFDNQNLLMNDLRITCVKSNPWNSTVCFSMFCPAMLHREAPLGIVSHGKSDKYFTYWVYINDSLNYFSESAGLLRMEWSTWSSPRAICIW